MGTMCWLIVLGAVVAIVAAPHPERHRSRPGPSWFDILPTLKAGGQRVRRRR